MIKKILKHSINCWISLNNTTLIDNDLYWLWLYQLVSCNDCWKQYVVFRDNENISLRNYDDINERLEDCINNIKNFFNTFENNRTTTYYNGKNQTIHVFTNIKDYMKNPLNFDDIIIIEGITDDWTTIKNVMFNDFLYNNNNN